MSLRREPISVRTTRLNNLILGHSNATSKTAKNVSEGLSREGLLDALCLLYDECNKEQLKKRDRNIFDFISKYRSIVREARSLRISIEDFSTKALIGKGYFGDVNLVSEKATGYIYAMKTINKSHFTSSQFKEERDIMTCRDSEWITNLQYSFQDVDHLYLVMEYLPGGDLLSLMARNGPFDEDLAKFYLAEINLAINALHCMGYVHRDVKPENILIDRLGHIKLADFGSAAAINRNGVVTSMSPVGTPDYIAPELLQTISSFKLSKSVHDVSCDYWSMGIIAYEMVCETTPFHHDNVHQTYSKILDYCEDGRADKLDFSSDIMLSPLLRNLIENLVTKPSKRIMYLQIIRHGFFEGIDWENIRQTVPPIIPNVNGDDDISNFEDIERTKNRRGTFSKKSSTSSLPTNEFSGQDLPFLGYGYIHQEKESITRKSIDSGGSSEDNSAWLSGRINDLRKTIKEQSGEIRSLQEKLLTAEKKATQTDSLNKILKDTKDEMNKMKEKLKEKAVELGSCKTEIKTLKSSLKIEEEMRLKTDATISELLTSTYQKWEKAKMTSDQNYEKLLMEKKTEISNISQKLIECESELIAKSDECGHLNEKLDNYKEMLKSLKDQSNNDRVDFDKSLKHLRMAYETQIKDLIGKLRLESKSRTKLNDELCNVRCELDESICSTNSNLEAKKATEKNIEDIKKRLNQEIEENGKLRSEKAFINKQLDEYEKMCEHLNSEIEKLKGEHQQVLDCRNSLESCIGMVTPYQTAHGSLTDLNNIEEQLRQDLEAAKENEDAQRKRADQLEKAVTRLEEILTKIGEKPLTAGDILEKQNEKLEDKLVALREQFVLERQSARTANLASWKLEKKVEELTSENKVLQRRIELTEDKVKKIQNDKSELERKLRETQSIIKQREEKIAELLLDIACVKKDLQKEHTMWEKAEHERMKEKSESLEHISKVHHLEEKLEESKRKLQTALQKNESLSFENKRILHEMRDNQDKASSLSETLNHLQLELKSSEDRYEMLKEACRVTDLQLSEIEVMLDTEVKRNKMNTEKIDELWKKIRAKDNELATLKQTLDSEMSNKNVAQTTVKELKQSQSEFQKQAESMQKQIVSQQKELITKTTSLFEAQEKIELLSTEMASLQTLNTNHEHEVVILKEENSKILTDLYLAKEEGNKLDRELREARQNITDLRQQVEQLNGTLSEQKNYYVQRDIKSDATMVQHKKLIDYLQLKIEELSQKRKRTLADKIFGSSTKDSRKDAVTANDVESSIVYRTLQEELKRERKRNDQLKEQLLQSKPDMRLVNAGADSGVNRFTNDGNEGSTQYKQEEQPNEKMDTFNNIETPQRDNGTISVVRSEKKSSLTGTLQIHRFELALEKSNTENSLWFCPICNKQILSGQPCWKCKECGLTVHRKCRSGVQSYCEGEQIKSYSSMATNGNNCDNDRNSNNTDLIKDGNMTEKNVLKDYNGELILKSTLTEPPLEINCIFEMDADTIVLGCKSGLYTYQITSRNLVHIAGIECVNYIAVTRAMSRAILIGSHGECLYECDFRVLENRSHANDCLKPKLEVSLLDLPFASRSLNEKWHLVRISDGARGASDDIAIAATSTRIVIMKYDLHKKRFKPVRALDTATAVSNILFTRYTAIVSSDKFFEIDLTSYTAEEFLDMSDTSLVPTRKNQPMAAFQISLQEFLLCFDEFGVFVDEYGYRSRPYNLSWCFTPTGFMYREPLLYISHFQLIQIIRVHRSYSNEMTQPAGASDDEDAEQNILRTYINMNMPVLQSECGKLNIYATSFQNDSNLQQVCVVDGAKALKSKTNVSLETLASQGTFMTFDSAPTIDNDIDTL